MYMYIYIYIYIHIYIYRWTSRKALESGVAARLADNAGVLNAGAMDPPWMLCRIRVRYIRHNKCQNYSLD